MSIPGNGHLPASDSLPDHSSASDSDADPESDYRPITADDSDSDSDPDFDAALPHHRIEETGNGISALDLASDEHEAAEVAEEDDGDGDPRPGAAAAARAFSEDERRRRAPLPAGAAARIVDAMRGVEFPGAPPAWAGSVPEDQWLDRLQSLRAGRPN
ncbi:hypothetical protein Zm00014a_030007 [Zea mays]|uniref:Uncharacterized protein n=1 Tax=Zea mays TaxID=4577 RepID=A0A3L6FHD1_MAIZE|nr:hypothetical protein Zm00014a_030007 [Zea mays]